MIDDKGLTVGQRLRHLRDEREMAAREKQRVHTEHRYTGYLLYHMYFGVYHKAYPGWAI